MVNNVISTIKKAFGESKVLRMVRNKYVVVSVFFRVMPASARELGRARRIPLLTLSSASQVFLSLSP